MIRSRAEEICWRIALTGNSKPHIIISVSNRARPSRHIGMQGRQRTIMTRIHGLEHVEGLSPPAFADHDAIWACGTGTHQVADGNLPPPLDVRCSTLQLHHVRLL